MRAEQYIDSLAASGRYHFTTSDAIEAIGCNDDAVRAKTAAESHNVTSFNWSNTVPLSALVDKGPKGDSSSAIGVIDQNNSKVLQGCQDAKADLTAGP